MSVQNRLAKLEKATRARARKSNPLQRLLVCIAGSGDPAQREKTPDEVKKLLRDAANHMREAK